MCYTVVTISLVPLESSDIFGWISVSDIFGWISVSDIVGWISVSEESRKIVQYYSIFHQEKLKRFCDVLNSHYMKFANWLFKTSRNLLNFSWWEIL